MINLLKFTFASIYVYYLFIILCIVEILFLLNMLIIIPFNIVNPINVLIRTKLNFSNIFPNIITMITFLFILAWFLKNFINLLKIFDDKQLKIALKKNNRFTLNKKNNTFIIFLILLGVISALYPYGTTVNPSNHNIGLNVTSQYIKDAKQVGRDFTQAFRVDDGQRPIIFLVLYFFNKILHIDIDSVVRYLPVFLNPLLGISSLILAFEIFNDENVAIYAGFLTLCSYQITINMYSYYQTNVLALSISLISLRFLFVAMKKNRKIDLLIACLLGITLVFTHIWTFYQYYSAIIITLIILIYFLNEDNKTILHILFIYLIILGSMTIMKNMFFIHTDQITQPLTMKNSVNIREHWINNILLRFYDIFKVPFLYNRLMFNFLLILLFMVGTYNLYCYNVEELYLVVFMHITFIIYIIGSLYTKGRFFYNIPIGILASYGLKNILESNYFKDMKNPIYYVVTLDSLNYLFRSLLNII